MLPSCSSCCGPPGGSATTAAACWLLLLLALLSLLLEYSVAGDCCFDFWLLKTENSESAPPRQPSSKPKW
jgi:hypothetical protein